IHTNAQTLTARPNVSMAPNTNGYYEYLPLGYNPAGSQTYPVLIAFGGLSQNGNGTLAQLDYVFSNWGGPGWQIQNGKFPSSLTVNGQLFRFIVILPQFSSGASPQGVNTLISYVIAHYKTDSTRIYLTGNSSGGGYCWDYPGASVQYGKRVAAIVPTCAASSYNTTKANNIAAANLPVWATHNAVDNTVCPCTTISFVNGINAALPPPNPLAKKTIFQDVGHNCADSTFNMTYGIGAYAWMLQYSRGTTPPVNQPPVANAGPDVTITLPTNSVQLNGNGSYDPDGTVASYSWAKTAGPGQFTISNSNIVNPVFSNLVAGTYTLSLTVTDNKGAKNTDFINVIVNPVPANVPPVANAGNDVTITLPTNSVQLNGNGSYDPDGTVASYSWTKTAGPAQFTISNSKIINPVFSNLIAGTYTLSLTVTDNKGATNTDFINVIVNPVPANQPPVAAAGNDVTITLPTNSVQLNGSSSYDPDGTIASYSWAKTAGPTQFTISNSKIVNPVFNNLVAGTYTLSLTVTDNKGATSTDFINVIVNPVAVNQPPVANAGPDVVITLPTNSVSLTGSGTDPDGTVASYAWTQVSGPSVSSIASPGTAKPTISNLIQGTYVFNLKVTDNNGATASDQMQLTVAPVTGGTKYINVNLYGGSNPYINSAWNNWNVGTAYTSNITSPLFTYSDGSLSGVKAVLSYSQAVGDNASNYGSGMAPAQVLEYTSDGQQPRTLTATGLSTSLKYSIELYASRWSINNSTIFTVNGTSVTISTYYNLTNKAVFTNITPNAQGQIVISIQSLTGWNYLNGFMITQQGTIGGSPSSITQAGSTSTGIKDATIEKNLSSVEIFPNPTTDNVIMQVTNSLSGIMKIQIINANGAVKRDIELKHASPVSKVRIPVNELPAGIYIIKVQVGNWSSSKKFIKS
ncbi:MAG: PKD domain-containing protein, partial [Bacteroidota bacterium]|nr:PKD domain-containing protein [Bacteroidota bacterium]